MPSLRLPGTMKFDGVVSLHSASSASFWRSRRCAGRALAGIKLRPRKSRVNLGGTGAGGVAARGWTGAWV